jgi:hypothetical protein
VLLAGPFGPFARNRKTNMKFTITVKCATGHTEILTKDLPSRASAEEFARVLRTGKCGVCEAQLDVTVRDPTRSNSTLN